MLIQVNLPDIKASSFSLFVSVVAIICVYIVSLLAQNGSHWHHIHEQKNI
jgi:Ca2+/H+ antiporter